MLINMLDLMSVRKKIMYLYSGVCIMSIHISVSSTHTRTFILYQCIYMRRILTYIFA